MSCLKNPKKFIGIPYKGEHEWKVITFYPFMKYIRDNWIVKKECKHSYVEFTSKKGDCIKGIYFVSEQDGYYLELKDEEVLQIVSKRSIKVYEPDRAKWPAWCGKLK
jgi:hypothetical protein